MANRLLTLNEAVAEMKAAARTACVEAGVEPTKEAVADLLFALAGIESTELQ